MLECWKEATEIETHFHNLNKAKTSDEIYKLWAKFHNTMYNESRASSVEMPLEAIIWQNILTEAKSETYLSKDNYIVQTWRNLEVKNLYYNC